jgi:hypothetical protein
MFLPPFQLGTHGSLTQLFTTTVALLIAIWFSILLGNVCLIACVQKILDGRKPSLTEGFCVTLTRIPKLIGWMVIVVFWGIPLTVIHGMLDRVSSVSGFLFGFGSSFMWGLATYFAIPLMTIENMGPIDAMRASSNLVERSWVQEVYGGVALGFVLIVVAIPSILLMGIPSAGYYLPALSLFLILLAYGVASSIYQTALYRFANTGEVPQGFESIFAPEA